MGASADCCQQSKDEEDSLHAGQIAVEVWDRPGSSNRFHFLNAYEEYGEWRRSARRKNGAICRGKQFGN